MHRNLVLIADDEGIVRQLVYNILCNDYLILEATDGETAVEMAQRHQPDVILMDIMMPNLDGYSAIFKLKSDAVTKHIPIVVLTALAYDLNKTFAEGAGANGYITKPFTQKDLLNTIGPLVKRSKQRSPFNEMVDIAQCGNSS